MLTNKTLNANVDPSAIGGTYTWSAESCTCVTACTGCSCVSFTDSTGTVIGTDFSTVVTYPDDCTSIVIKLTIVTVEEEEQCVSTFYYNIIDELGGPQLTWACLANEGGCMQIPSENQIFETAYDCLNCATCPCSTSNVCQDATFQAEYDCITHELTITSANQIDWCTVPYPVIETVNIVLNFTQGNYTHAETINLPCNTALPLVIDLTADPLPEGFYYIHVIMQLDGCQVNIDSVEIDCPGGGTGPFNVGCCAYNAGNDSYTLGQGQPPVVYTAGLTMPMVSDLIIDFHSLIQADKLSVYSSWNNALQTGTEMATTGFVGLCGNCCNTDYYPFKQGYYEHEYLGALNTPTESSYQTCNGGVLSGTPTPVPGDFTFYAQSAGTARLILPAAYINTYAPSGTLFIVVFNNNGRTASCPCGTIWEWRMFCGESCPCTEPPEPEAIITPAVCDISPGLITITEQCNGVNNQPGEMEWSNDGITWIAGEPLYAGLPALNAVTQTLYIRCKLTYNPTCTSDTVEIDYIKPECCVDDYNFTFECNPLTVGIYNQVDYQYRVIYEIPTCDDTTNPAIVEYVITTPLTGNFAYQVLFSGSSVILEVYFNSGSEYFFKVNCNLCWTAQYYIQINESQLANLLATHACEPCDIELYPRFDLGSSSFYISLDNDFGTADFPSIPQGQPPYILTITKNGILTIAGIVLSYNGTILNTGPIYLTTTLMPNLSGEYTIVGYYPVVPGAPPVRNTNINYGFFLTLAYPGQYVINVTDHDGCIAETIVCNITAELSSCTANALYATMSGIIHTTQTFEDIIIDGITYASGGIVFNVNPAITKAAILAFLNTIPIVGASFAVDIAATLAETQMLVITYLNCDAVASLEFNTSSPTLSSSVFVPEEPIINTTWTVNIVPAFAITSYAWSLGDDLVLISGTLTDSTITTSGGGNLSVQVFTDECNPVTANACTPTVDIVSCALEYTKVSINHLPGANALNYYFKGLVANGINISSANIQLVGSDVTAAAVVEANILSFLNTNLRPSVGGVFDVNYTSTPSTSDLGVKWCKCEGTITDIQLRLNESDNTTPANSAVNTSTVFRPNTYILTLDYSPNVPITSYTWTLNGPTLGLGELTDSIIVVQGGGDVDIEIEVLDCGTATDSTCIYDIDFVTCPGGIYENESDPLFNGDLFTGVIVDGITYTATPAIQVMSIGNINIAAIQAFLNTEVVPNTGGSFIVYPDSVEPKTCRIFYINCYDALLTFEGLYETSIGGAINTTSVAPFNGGDNIIYITVTPTGTLTDYNWSLDGTLTTSSSLTDSVLVITGGSGNVSVLATLEGCGTVGGNTTI